MSEAAPNFEMLLREALQPVEPPQDLVNRLESTLASLTALAADELEAWELSAMRDPRNWLRPAAAVVIGATAGAGLVVLRAKRQASQRRRHGLGTVRGGADQAQQALEDLGREVGRMVRERRRRPRR